jgi:hypothetical protein
MGPTVRLGRFGKEINLLILPFMETQFLRCAAHNLFMEESRKLNTNSDDEGWKVSRYRPSHIPIPVLCAFSLHFTDLKGRLEKLGSGNKHSNAKSFFLSEMYT